jgi:DNA-binding MarR family transcriptional regulator
MNSTTGLKLRRRILIYINLFDINLFVKNGFRPLAARGVTRKGAYPMTEGRRQAADIDHGPLVDLVSYYIRLVQIAAFKNFEEVTKQLGVAPRYFGLLSLIETNPGLPQSRLAEAIHLLRSSIVPILDTLEVEGLVERRSSSADRRRKSVWLTPKGKKVVGRVRNLVLKHEECLLNGFSRQEKRQLLDLLKRVDGNLRMPIRAADVA